VSHLFKVHYQRFFFNDKVINCNLFLRFTKFPKEFVTKNGFSKIKSVLDYFKTLQIKNMNFNIIVLLYL